MNAFRTLLLLVLLCPVAFAADPDVAKLYEKAQKEQRSMELAVLDGTITHWKNKEAVLAKTKPSAKGNGWSGGKYPEVGTFTGTAAAIKTEQKKVSDKLKELDEQRAKQEKAPLPVPVIDASNLSVGDIGLPRYNRITVPEATVYEVVDKGNVILRRGATKELLWYKTDTTGLVDNKRLPLTFVIYVSGTKKHGSSTMLVIEQYTPK